MEDKDIIKLFFDRSEEAVAALNKKYGSLCRSIAYNVLKSREDAEECVNDTYLSVWNSIPPESPTRLSAYVGRIARNKSLSRYRKNTAAVRNSEYDTSLDELSECVPSKVRTEDELDARELSAAINAFLAELNKDSRLLFMLRYWGGYSISDAARLLGITPNAASVRLSRLREKLKEQLIKEGLL